MNALNESGRPDDRSLNNNASQREELLQAQASHDADLNQQIDDLKLRLQSYPDTHTSDDGLSAQSPVGEESLGSHGRSTRKIVKFGFDFLRGREKKLPATNNSVDPDNTKPTVSYDDLSTGSYRGFPKRRKPINIRDIRHIIPSKELNIEGYRSLSATHHSTESEDIRPTIASKESNTEGYHSSPTTHKPIKRDITHLVNSSEEPDVRSYGDLPKTYKPIKPANTYPLIPSAEFNTRSYREPPKTYKPIQVDYSHPNFASGDFVNRSYMGSPLQQLEDRALSMQAMLPSTNGRAGSGHAAVAESALIAVTPATPKRVRFVTPEDTSHPQEATVSNEAETAGTSAHRDEPRAPRAIHYSPSSPRAGPIPTIARSQVKRISGLGIFSEPGSPHRTFSPLIRSASPELDQSPAVTRTVRQRQARMEELRLAHATTPQILVEADAAAEAGLGIFVPPVYNPRGRRGPPVATLPTIDEQPAVTADDAASSPVMEKHEKRKSLATSLGLLFEPPITSGDLQFSPAVRASLAPATPTPTPVGVQIGHVAFNNETGELTARYDGEHPRTEVVAVHPVFRRDAVALAERGPRTPNQLAQAMFRETYQQRVMFKGALSSMRCG
ncbi:hypothetical protein B0A49_02850 [Cryomyces minteri]|uniref:Uncharacterized protein n=1 Tax=Cryomyces minteri TaxID=331657 RepID=A0A4U0XRK3_9PEZI|nr:hypothetical protein B0A49_02850 [Cryomyces minteri]